MSPPRHMTSDDAFPEKTPGKLRLYSMQYCPFALRARLMLEKKCVDYEVININLQKKPSWFLEKYPIGTVPVMEIDDKLLGGSLVVSNYIDEVYSKDGDRSVPQDPYEKGKTNMLIDDKFSKAIGAVYKRLFAKEGWQEDFYKELGELDKILENNKFFTGDRISFADYMVYPWMRLIVTDPEGEFSDVVSGGRLPNLIRWVNDMKEDETVKKCHTPPAVLKEAAKGYATGNYVFDLE